MSYSTVLFDLDGTLTDPAAGITNSMSYALDALGLQPPDAEQLRGFIGPPLQEVFPALGLDPPTCETAIRHYREYFAEKGLFENEPYTGIEQVLSVLRERGVRLAVATSKPTVFADRILEHFGLDHLFDCVSGAELDGSRRHKDDIIAHALRLLQLQSTDGVVMVGDREHDVLGARRIGMPCIGVRWGFGTDAELIAAGATRLVADREELLHALTCDDRSPSASA